MDVQAKGPVAGSAAVYDPEKRSLLMESPLGRANVILTAVRGVEAVSAPFRFDIEFATSKPVDQVSDLLGQPVTLWLCNEKERDRRPVNGLVSRLSGPAPGPRGLRIWRAELVPRLAFLGYSADCRIFQNKTVPEILTTVFKDHGLDDFEIKGLLGAYPQVDYCVQYRESAFDFASRLMEHVGLFYWHEHADGAHKLMISDNANWLPAALDGKAVLSRRAQFPDIVSLANDYAFRPGKWALSDYDFKSPAMSLHTDAPTVIGRPAMKRHEMFDYPGHYTGLAEGGALARVRMECEEAGYQRLSGEGRRARFCAGHKLEIAADDREALELPAKLLLLEVRHDASDRTQLTEDAAPPRYGNTFIALPGSVPFRPERRTPKPHMRGIQTAVVMGPSGETIHTDRYGRVKVRFFWDRNPAGNSDEHRSCWLRVSQAWADGGFGAVHLPRVGQEVIVDFLEGDPDRPIITGRVYNGDKAHPYDLPAHKTRSGFRTSSVDGVGYNELRFEDQGGQEEVHLHAQKDLTGKVLHDHTHDVGHDQMTSVGNNQTTNVSGDTTHMTANTYTQQASSNVTIADTAKSTFGTALATIQSSTTMAEESIALTGVSTAVTGEAMAVTGQSGAIVGNALAINAFVTALNGVNTALNAIAITVNGVAMATNGVNIGVDGIGLSTCALDLTENEASVTTTDLTAVV